jgi:phosphoribosylformylglycinamidine synthase
MSMTVGIVVFPGSNCDRDLAWALKGVLNLPIKYLWHGEQSILKVDAIVLPGGFSYGDYLRCGALARFAPLLAEVKSFAEGGGPVLGICNGFQILTEMGLLPGALTRNKNLRFICSDCELIVNPGKNLFLQNYQSNQIINCPIAHGEGRYHCDQETLKHLEQNDLIVLRYANNPNGSIGDIAGITNQRGNVLGMMPHPERACDPVLGGVDGQKILKGLVKT